MTQLELPPISIGRYFELLKRKRWQVVPISLVGLLVGGLVAFVIPRYYVASTTVSFNGPVLNPKLVGNDPMAVVVDSAQITIPAIVPKVLEEIGWPEARVEEVAERRGYVDAVRERIKIQDLGPWDKGRSKAHLMVSYSDLNGERAKEFADKLLEVWSVEQKQNLIARADEELGGINERIRIATDALENAEQEMASFEKVNDLNPEDFVGSRTGGLSERSREMQMVADQVSSLRGQIAGVVSRIAGNRSKLDQTPTKLSVAREIGMSSPLQEAIQVATLKLLVATKALGGIKPIHPNYLNYLRQQQEATATLAALQASVGETQMQEVENPVYAQLQLDIDADDARLSEFREQLVGREQRVQELSVRVARLPEIVRDHRALESKRADARENLQRLVTSRSAMEVRKRSLAYDKPYEILEPAYVPPLPTEPNITLVALIGSAIGLALAIGLVLLIDVLQTTYKTVSDVSRGLSVPVLGSMSHMLTIEQARETHARRTRASLVAGAFLVLMISLVTIYYVAPTRLPIMVRDVLGLILGSP